MWMVSSRDMLFRLNNKNIFPNKTHAGMDGEILLRSFLLLALGALVSCSRPQLQSNDRGVKLGEEPLVVFSYPGQKTSEFELSIKNQSAQPVELSTIHPTTPFFYLTIPSIHLMPNETTECMATVHFREEYIVPEDKTDKETYELTGEMVPATQSQAPYEGRAIKFKLIRDKLFREKPDESVKIIVPDEALPTVDLRLETYRVMDEIKLEQTNDILDITKSQSGREITLGFTPVKGLKVGTYTTHLLFSGLLAGEPTRRDHSISVMVVKMDPIGINPDTILLGMKPKGTISQERVVITTNSEDPLSLIEHSTAKADTTVENLGIEDGRIMLRIVQKITGTGNQTREIQLKLGLGDKVFERKIVIRWYIQ